MKKELSAVILAKELKHYSKEINATVAKINVLAEKNVESWVEMGRLVNQFVLRVTENRTKWVNAYKLLASSPNSNHQDSQLRNYEGAYLLWEKIHQKGEKISLSMTHMLAVIHSGGNFDGKLKMLKIAADKKLSVAELKAEIKAEATKKKRIAEDNAKNGIDYISSVKRVRGSVCQCYSYCSEFARIKGKQKLPQDVKSNLINLMEFILGQKLIELSDLNINMNINTNTEERKAA